MYQNVDMVGEAGIEPTTPGLEGRCSIQLSYSPGKVAAECVTAVHRDLYRVYPMSPLGKRRYLRSIRELTA